MQYEVCFVNARFSLQGSFVWANTGVVYFYQILGYYTIQ